MRRDVTALLLLFTLLPLCQSATRGAWTLVEGANADGPGRQVLIQSDGRDVARFIHGDGQIKPYLHVYGEEGELITNGGLDAAGKTAGRFPHHRGLFIGWVTTSDLGRFDLWHMNNGGKMDVVKFDKLQGGADAATLVATVAWRGGKRDADGNDLLLAETRTLVLSRPGGKFLQIDARFALDPARDVNLAGDLQHSGVHFRAANSVAEQAARTSYLFEPDGVVNGSNLAWCQLLFPVGQRWYACQEMNAPSNPVEELSMRDYGRFGYFFKRPLKKGEILTLNYRFAIAVVEAPAANPKRSPEQAAQARAECQARFALFATSLRR